MRPLSRLPLQSAPHSDSAEEPIPGARCPEVPGLEQRVGRLPPARRRAPLSPARLEPDPSPWPRLISNTKPGVGRPLSTQPGAAGRTPREGAGGREQTVSQPCRARHGLRAGKSAWAPLPASTCAPRALGDSETSPYPPATGVGAPRSAGAASGHGQLVSRAPGRARLAVPEQGGCGAPGVHPSWS